MKELYVKSVFLEEEPGDDSYFSSIPCIRDLSKEALTFESDVSFFIGENGSGKSTLLEAIAVSMGFNPEGGTRNFTFSNNDTHSDLYKYLTISRNAYFEDGFFFRAESFYNLASNIDELDKAGGNRRLIDSYGGISLHAQSHGQSFISVFKNRFSRKGLYLMDEPESALSPSGLMQLLVCINDLTKQDCQFIIATHSPILMSYPGADVFEFTEEGIIKTDYRESEHYRIYKDFIERPEQMFHYLFKE